METVLAILLVLGIFIGIPAVIGFAIAGVYIMSDRRSRRAQRVMTEPRAEPKPLRQTYPSPL
jgi:hypothetical protein